MNTTTTTQPISPATVALDPEWIRVPQATQWSGMGRTLINQLAVAGKIKSGDVVVIRYEGPKGGPGMREMLAVAGKIKSVNYRQKGTSRGFRLISFPSLRAFVDGLASGGEVQS